MHLSYQTQLNCRNWQNRTACNEKLEVMVNYTSSGAYDAPTFRFDFEM